MPARCPVHVTVRLRPGLPSLRRRDEGRVLVTDTERTVVHQWMQIKIIIHTITVGISDRGISTTLVFLEQCVIAWIEKVIGARGGDCILRQTIRSRPR